MDEPTTRATVLDREGPSRCGVARHQPVLSALEGRNDTGRVDLSPVSEGLTYPPFEPHRSTPSQVPQFPSSLRLRPLAGSSSGLAPLAPSPLQRCRLEALGQNWPGIDDFGQIREPFPRVRREGKGMGGIISRRNLLNGQLFPQFLRGQSEELPEAQLGEPQTHQAVGRLALASAGSEPPQVPVQSLQVQQSLRHLAVPCLQHPRHAVDAFHQATRPPGPAEHRLDPPRLVAPIRTRLGQLDRATDAQTRAATDRRRGRRRSPSRSSNADRTSGANPSSASRPCT